MKSTPANPPVKNPGSLGRMRSSRLSALTVGARAASRRGWLYGSASAFSRGSRTPGAKHARSTAGSPPGDRRPAVRAKTRQRCRRRQDRPCPPTVPRSRQLAAELSRVVADPNRRGRSGTRTMPDASAGLGSPAAHEADKNRVLAALVTNFQVYLVDSRRPAAWPARTFVAGSDALR